MIPWVILLRMLIFSDLCDPWRSCDDKDQSVADGEAAWWVPPLYVGLTPPPLTEVAPPSLFSTFFHHFSGPDFH